MRRSDRTWRLDHVSSVAQTYSVPSSIGLHDGACAVIGLVTGPIALQFEQDLDPADPPGPGGPRPSPEPRIYGADKGAVKKILAPT
jgi:hypothetical protein